ncbi:hypothetical protein [Spirosoma sp. KNUC1025]
MPKRIAKKCLCSEPGRNYTDFRNYGAATPWSGIPVRDHSH